LKERESWGGESELIEKDYVLEEVGNWRLKIRGKREG
jgi:hypothetical protein